MPGVMPAALFAVSYLLGSVVMGILYSRLRGDDIRSRDLPGGSGTFRQYGRQAAVLVSVWAHVGFYALILLAGLQAIPRELYEAAEMDGTRPARVFARITLPLLAPNLLVVVLLAQIRAVQIFDEAYVLTGGGPGTATMFMTQYIVETGFASATRDPGLAAAASMLMAGVLVVLTLLQLWRQRAAR